MRDARNVQSMRTVFALAAVIGTLSAARAANAANDASGAGPVPGAAENPPVVTADDAGLVAPPAVDSAAAQGIYLPFTQAPTLGAPAAVALGLGGYDSARKASSFEAAAEVRLFGPVTLRGGAVLTSTGGGTLRPTIGARVQLLREGRHGVDGAIGVFYRPEGLTEPEGEIETVVAVGRQVGRARLLGNLLYGQDPEGNERDGEVRLAALTAVRPRLFAGLDSRARFDLGSNAAKLAQHNEATLDILVGPTVAMLVGPVALSVHAGGSAVRLQGATSYGGFGLLGIGTAL